MIDPSAIARGAARGAIGCVGRPVMMVIVLLARPAGLFGKAA